MCNSLTYLWGFLIMLGASQSSHHTLFKDRFSNQYGTTDID